MPRTTSKAKVGLRRRWTQRDFARLKQLAKQGASGADIAKLLNRSAGAVYQQAAIKKVRFRRSAAGGSKRKVGRRKR